MQKENSAPLLLLQINSLLDKSFFIPAYQRGFRWKKKQVEDLLEDIWNFNPPTVIEGEKPETYCLQPIVVRNVADAKAPLWEVIDGQQRLTTIKIILEYLHSLAPQWVPKPFALTYETRKDKNGIDYFASMADSRQAGQSIDAFHIHAAYTAVVEWFEEKKKLNNAVMSGFHTKIINDTSAIWYDVANVSTVQNETTAIDIFTRLNIGKIALTNAELIKALFMQRGNFAENEIETMQLQIATEWDLIQKKLENDSFWFFIYNPPKMAAAGHKSFYDTRFEYIFDLIVEKKNDDEPYETFIKFNKLFKEKVKTSTDVLTLWREVKNYFLILEEWYENTDLYHLIGFLISCGVAPQKIFEKSLQDKDKFRKELEDKIRNLFAKPLEKIDYTDRKNTRNVLLLFNVLTTNSKNSNTRFPFDRYKNGDWDIEHVRSQRDKELTPASWQGWAIDILIFFSGCTEDAQNMDSLKEAVLEYLEFLEADASTPGKRVQGTSAKLNIDRSRSLRALRTVENDVKKDICTTLLRLLQEEDPDFEEIKAVYENVLGLYGENTPMDDSNNIANLALLDSSTNRSYQNAMFPVKRKTIVENEMNGVFVPVCTKNLFMKFYSKGDTDIMSWSANDADAYLAEMSQCLKEYLPQNKEASHG